MSATVSLVSSIQVSKLRENLRKKMTTVSRDIGETRDYILLGKSILLLRVCILFIVGRGERGEGGERRIFVEKTGNLRDDPPPLEIFHVLFFFF